MSFYKRILPFLFLILFLSSCKTGNRLTYYWGQYENNTYDFYKKHSPQALCDMMVMYQDLITNAGGSRNVPPPGVCAEFGYLLLTPENVNTYVQNASKQQLKRFSSDDYAAYGVMLLQKEIEYYPESAQFLKPILDNISK